MDPSTVSVFGTYEFRQCHRSDVSNRLESSSFVFNILFGAALLEAHWDGFYSKPAASLSDFPWDEACFSSLC